MDFFAPSLAFMNIYFITYFNYSFSWVVAFLNGGSELG